MSHPNPSLSRCVSIRRKFCNQKPWTSLDGPNVDVYDETRREIEDVQEGSGWSETTHEGETFDLLSDERVLGQ